MDEIDAEEAAEARIEIGDALCGTDSGAALMQHHGTEGEKQ